MQYFRRSLLLILCFLVLSACNETATLSVKEGSGPEPILPAPNPQLVPTVKIAPATEATRLVLEVTSRNEKVRLPADT